MLGEQGYVHARACTHSRARVHARTRTDTQICDVYCFFTAKMIRERAFLLRYTYIVL